LEIETMCELQTTCLPNLFRDFLEAFARRGHGMGTQLHHRRYLGRFMQWAAISGIHTADDLNAHSLLLIRIHLHEAINEQDGYRLSSTVKTRTLSRLTRWLNWMDHQGFLSSPLTPHVGKPLSRSEYDSLRELSIANESSDFESHRRDRLS
jgi:site-specific recombinase XerD